MYTKNLIIICVDDKLKSMLSEPKIIIFSHKELTLDFSSTLAKMGVCPPYLQQAASEKTPDKIFEHIKFMLIKGNITLPIDNQCSLNVLSSLEQDNISFKAIDDMTKTDPALHSGILRTANSAYYSSGYSEIVEVEKALVRIGLANAKAFLINFINKSLASNKDLIFAEEIGKAVQDSLIIASLCYSMAEFFKVCSKSSMFSIGILSKLGEIFMFAIISEYLSGENFSGMKPSGYDNIATGNSLMVGGMLLKKWKFPEEYYTPVLNCGTVGENQYMNETRLLHLGCNLVEYFNSGQVDNKVLEALDKTGIKLSEKQLQKIRTEAIKHLQEIKSIL